MMIYPSATICSNLNIFRPDTASRYKAGCVVALKSFLSGKCGVLGAMAVIVALVQIIIIAGASVLVSKWKVPGQCYPCY